MIRTYQSIPSFSLANVCYQQVVRPLTCIDGNSRERASLGLMVNDRGGPWYAELRIGQIGIKNLVFDGCAKLCE
jgi:hypothetical protein